MNMTKQIIYKIIYNVCMYMAFVTYDISSEHDLSKNINILLFIMSANNPYHLYFFNEFGIYALLYIN